MRTTLVALSIVMSVSSAAADDKADAQKKVDEAKVKTCEASKAYVMKQEKTCPDEAAAAKSITCTAAETARVLDLQKACLEKTAAAKPPETCRVLDPDGKPLEDLGSLTALDCLKKARETVKAKSCTPENKGKTMKYQVQRGDRKPTPGIAYCG